MPDGNLLAFHWKLPARVAPVHPAVVEVHVFEPGGSHPAGDQRVGGRFDEALAQVALERVPRVPAEWGCRGQRGGRGAVVAAVCRGRRVRPRIDDSRRARIGCGARRAASRAAHRVVARPRREASHPRSGRRDCVGCGPRRNRGVRTRVGGRASDEPAAQRDGAHRPARAQRHDARASEWSVPCELPPPTARSPRRRCSPGRRRRSRRAGCRRSCTLRRTFPRRRCCCPRRSPG